MAEEVLSKLAAENQIEEVPEEVFKELIDPLKERPEPVLRHTLDHRRPESHKYTRDEDIEAQVKRSVKELLERTRKKKAALALERTRRKYNRLMKKALQNCAIKERRKIQYYNKQIDNKNTLTKTVDRTEENDNKTSFNKQKNELLVEHFSIDDIDKTNEATNDTNKERTDDTEYSPTLNKNMLIGEIPTNQDPEVNIDDEIICQNRDNTSFRKAHNDLLVEELPVNLDSIDGTDNTGNNNANEVITAAEQIDGQTEENDQVEKAEGRNKKLKLNIHQCYVCFKLFETKGNLLDHCKSHFDVSNIKTWKKCPLCKYTTDLSVTKHLKTVHDIEIKLPYGTFKDDNNDILKSKYYYDVGDEIINKVEIIPSLKNLNRLEYTKIDKANRKNKDKGITRNKLVKKGKEWIVVKEKVKIKDCLLPKLDETANLNVTGGYIEHMKELYRVAKKKGVKMLFPCDSCDKVCQTLSALKLHGRKHEVNPKPFRPKVWKHKVNVKKNKPNEAKPKKSNKVKVKTIINKNVELPKLDRRTKQAQNDLYKEANRQSKPQPIVNKHRCNRELKEFYESNIRGGDIEFWQFLKIYNKMSRENINDFSDLESTTAFGYHTEVPVSSNTEVEKDTNKNDARSKVSVRNRNTRVLEFKKARLSKKEIEKKRNEIKKKLREEIRRRAGRED
ncbi:hypothetical protein MSG28_016026 [Choristoneura fumiferana]|uniref:Uncharacterized protein n=1 Tax=Choristoneura fumiferana TaxID=7141 RepID=A0ACC0K516_CHOFU|nr:hypothetical protein MSG28_016026 [Choristoneura fumiferana]